MLKVLKEELKDIKRSPIKWCIRVVLDHSAWYVALGLIWSIQTYGLKYFKDSALTDTEKIVVGSVFAVAILLSIVLYSFFNKIIFIYKENNRLTQIIESFGIKGFYPYNSKEEREEEWSSLVSEFKKNNPQNLKVLALNGWETFASQDAPLHDYINKFENKLTVLLIDPNCEACDFRVNALEINKEQFKLDHDKSVSFCRSLKSKGIDIQLFFYSQRPIWKMIGTESYVWLQHYDKFSHVDENPVYEFYKNKEKTSMYFPLLAIIEKKLQSDGNVEIKLD